MLNLLRQTTEAMVEAPTLQSAADILVQRVQSALTADAASIYLQNDVLGGFDLRAVAYADHATQTKCSHLPSGQGLVSVVAKQKKPLNLTEAHQHPDYIESRQQVKQGFWAFLGVPISYRQQVLGVVVVQRLAQEPFSTGDESFLVTLAAQIAATVAHALEVGRLDARLQSEEGRSSITLTGQGVATGVCIGEAVVITPPADLQAVPDRPVENAAEEIETLQHAIDAVEADIMAMEERLSPLLSDEQRSLFDVYIKMLHSKRFKQAIIDTIKAGAWVQSALRKVVHDNVQAFEQMSDSYLQERADDIRDVGRRVLAYLQQQDHKPKQYPKNAILVGAEISASMLAEVPKGCLKGVVSSAGSSNSHAAILANALGVPAVMGIDPLPVTNMSGCDIILDGYAGRVYVQPNVALLSAYEHLVQEEEELASDLEQLKGLPAETQDAHIVSLMANTGLVSDVNPALKVESDGIGLYRSEVPFMMLNRFPSEEEQRIIYRQMLTAFSGRPVTMRTLDIGGDKILPYFQHEETNPFLGWRGIRVSLDHTDIFVSQVRAMLKANVGLNNLKILLPMITSLDEIHQAKQLIEQALFSVQNEGVAVRMPQVGIMIEVPAILYQLETVLAEVDFVSVGSNDLIQYLLAVDRGNTKVAKHYESFHPAVLRVLYSIAQIAEREGKAASICGELASHPMAIPLLVGMGYVGLSMSPGSILKAKWVLRGFTRDQCFLLLQEVLRHQSVQEIQNILTNCLVENGFGGLLRAGKF